MQCDAVDRLDISLTEVADGMQRDAVDQLDTSLKMAGDNA
jgi:hypothetical protein